MAFARFPLVVVARLAWSALVVGCAVNPVPTPATAASLADSAFAGSDAAATNGNVDTAAATDTTQGAETVAFEDTGVAPPSDTDAAAASDGAADLPAVASLPPNGKEALLPWLQAGNYANWPAESKPHPSTGPHFGGVRTFVNPALLQSLQAGNAVHPQDAATVKELYGSGTTVIGWSVMRKTQAGAGGDTWRWFETYQGKVYADGQGVGLCTGCHSPGKDFVLSPFPLQ